MSYFETRNEIKEENWSFLQIFTKISEKNIMGAFYVDFGQNSKFRFFRRNFAFKRLQRLESACSNFFGGDLKISYLGSFHHKNLGNWPKNEKLIAFQSFELQKTT